MIRLLSLAVFVKVIVGVGRCPERVIGIFLELLKSSKFVRHPALVCVEANVNAFRKVVAVHRHALKIVLVPDLHADLRVIGRAEREFGNATSDLDDAVPIRTTLFGPSHRQAFRVES